MILLYRDQFSLCVSERVCVCDMDIHSCIPSLAKILAIMHMYISVCISAFILQIKTLSETLHDHWKETCYGDPPPCKHAFYDLDKRRELLHITTFLWLPHIIRSPETSAIILVVTTESRHVVFLRCVFNLLQG